MKCLEDSLVTTSSIREAHGLIHSKVEALMGMSGETEVANKGLNYAAYLCDYWTMDALWGCWSEFGW
jgi:hypothetical protein